MARFAATAPRRRGLPEPELNAWLPLGAEGARPDCLWRGHGLVAELDGYGSHGTRPAFESDRRRDRRLQAEGWTVVRVTGPSFATSPMRLPSTWGACWTRTDGRRTTCEDLRQNVRMR